MLLRINQNSKIQIPKSKITLANYAKPGNLESILDSHSPIPAAINDLILTPDFPDFNSFEF
jgi:hypothetical protein